MIDLAAIARKKRLRAGAGGGAEPFALSSDTWYHAGTPDWPLAVVPTIINGHAAFTDDDGLIHIAGGYDGTIAVATHRTFDVVANTWGTAQSLPGARHQVCGCWFLGKGYIFGGLDGANPSASVFEYDKGAGSWTELVADPLPVALKRSTCIAGTITGLGVRALVCGGRNTAGGRVQTVYGFDPTADAGSKWTTLANFDASSGAEYMAGALVAGAAHLAGGFESAAINKHRNDDYDPVDAWSSLTALPASIYGCAGAALGGRFHVFGDRGANKTFHRAWNGATWLAPAAMYQGVAYHASTVRQGILYVIGGYDGASQVDTVQAYVPTEGANRPY